MKATVSAVLSTMSLFWVRTQLSTAELPCSSQCLRQASWWPEGVPPHHRKLAPQWQRLLNPVCLGSDVKNCLAIRNVAVEEQNWKGDVNYLFRRADIDVRASGGFICELGRSCGSLGPLSGCKVVIAGFRLHAATGVSHVQRPSSAKKVLMIQLISC